MGHRSPRALHTIIRILSFTLNVKLFKCFVQTSDINGLHFFLKYFPPGCVENRLEEGESARSYGDNVGILIQHANCRGDEK